MPFTRDSDVRDTREGGSTPCRTWLNELGAAHGPICERRSGGQRHERVEVRHRRDRAVPQRVLLREQPQHRLQYVPELDVGCRVPAMMEENALLSRDTSRSNIGMR